MDDLEKYDKSRSGNKLTGGKEMVKGSDSKMEISSKHTVMRVPTFLSGNKFKLLGNQLVYSFKT